MCVALLLVFADVCRTTSVAKVRLIASIGVLTRHKISSTRYLNAYKVDLLSAFKLVRPLFSRSGIAGENGESVDTDSTFTRVHCGEHIHQPPPDIA